MLISGFCCTYPLGVFSNIPVSFSFCWAFIIVLHAWHRLASAILSASVSTRILIRIFTNRRHSYFASKSKCAGHAGGTGRGCGSHWFSGRLPGFPRCSLRAVGSGAGPRSPIGPPSFAATRYMHKSLSISSISSSGGSAQMHVRAAGVKPNSFASLFTVSIEEGTMLMSGFCCT